MSAVRFYEINPVGAPSLRRNGLIAAPSTFLYNAAISPDRRVDGRRQFGGSFVVGYSASSAVNGIDPRIVMSSSVDGGALSAVLVRDAVGPYRDFSCAVSGDICRWGDYSGASPDPRPGTTNHGVVWLTDQFAGSASISTASPTGAPGSGPPSRERRWAGRSPRDLPRRPESRRRASVLDGAVLVEEVEAALAADAGMLADRLLDRGRGVGMLAQVASWRSRGPGRSAANSS